MQIKFESNNITFRHFNGSKEERSLRSDSKVVDDLNLINYYQQLVTSTGKQQMTIECQTTKQLVTITYKQQLTSECQTTKQLMTGTGKEQVTIECQNTKQLVTSTGTEPTDPGEAGPGERKPVAARSRKKTRTTNSRIWEKRARPGAKGARAISPGEAGPRTAGPGAARPQEQDLKSIME
ncbi:hypothetical protein RRG08_037356 [Elysia crispata]|uniref:Uncharacterized protein n=1 Tax=Elysia crispata TaxID=231223 RepID=A0AAE1AB12_9GAST|nr:hypothetical protein RRG08_037356 [Elysia crispata]